MTPTLNVDKAVWEDAEREQEFWRKHYEEFLRRYPDQFVAVREKEVVASAYDLRDLVAALQERGLEPGDVWVQYFETKPRAMML
ncbi:MAG: DUF5678 domain-containing protein [Dehalococcoidia bacterium]